MENEFDASSKVKTWIIVGVVALITFILVFVVTNKLINGNKKKTTTTPTVELEKYDAYKVGDTVTLKNGTTWRVVYESKEDSEYLTLLSDNDVNSSGVLYGNVNSFLKGTYKTELTSALGCQSSDIQEIRLLAYLDLAALSGANSGDFLPDTELSKFTFPDWVYAKATVTDTIWQTEKSNNPIVICTPDISESILAKDEEETEKKETTDNGSTNSVTTAPAENTTTNDTTKTDLTKTNRFCLGDATVSLPLRPVLVVSKKIFKTTSTEGTTSTDNNASSK